MVGVFFLTACGGSQANLREATRPKWVEQPPKGASGTLVVMGRSLGAKSPGNARAEAGEDARLQAIERVVGLDTGFRSDNLSGSDAELSRKRVLVLSRRVNLRVAEQELYIEPSPYSSAGYDGYVLLELNPEQLAQLVQEAERVRRLPASDLDQDLRGPELVLPKTEELPVDAKEVSSGRNSAYLWVAGGLAVASVVSFIVSSNAKSELDRQVPPIDRNRRSQLMNQGQVADGIGIGAAVLSGGLGAVWLFSGSF